MPGDGVRRGGRAVPALLAPPVPPRLSRVSASPHAALPQLGSTARPVTAASPVPSRLGATVRLVTVAPWARPPPGSAMLRSHPRPGRRRLVDGAVGTGRPPLCHSRPPELKVGFVGAAFSCLNRLLASPCFYKHRASRRCQTSVDCS